MTDGDNGSIPPSSAPTSWRDVYALVQDAEKRLTVSITEGFARQTSVNADHEVRLRLLEANDLKQRGGIAALGAGRALLVTIISIGALAASILALVHP